MLAPDVIGPILEQAAELFVDGHAMETVSLECELAGALPEALEDHLPPDAPWNYTRKANYVLRQSIIAMSEFGGNQYMEQGFRPLVGQVFFSYVRKLYEEEPAAVDRHSPRVVGALAVYALSARS